MRRILYYLIDPNNVAIAIFKNWDKACQRCGEMNEGRDGLGKYYLYQHYTKESVCGIGNAREDANTNV